MSLWQRAQDSIAQGSLTNSKSPHSFIYGIYPTHIISGSGAKLTAEDGKSYIDFICGLGTNLLGYGNPKIATALRPILDLGNSHSLPTKFEVESAEALKKFFHFCEVFKFLKSGSEACSAALRIARTYTGRSWVMSEGYHGFHDEFVSLTEPAVGVPPKMFIEPLDINRISTDHAAVIIEPVITDHSQERRDFLNKLREVCTQKGVMLIFDEIITGYRFLSHSVSNHWNIRPDLLIVSKAMANGLSISAIGGPKEVMNGPYFVSTTFAGEILAHVAAKKVAELLTYDTDYKITELWEKGQNWLDKFNSFGCDILTIEGFPTRGRLVGEDLNKALFMQEACECGFLMGPSWFYNWHLSHYDDIVLPSFKDIIDKIKAGKIALKGEMPKSPFTTKFREEKNG